MAHTCGKLKSWRSLCCWILVTFLHRFCTNFVNVFRRCCIGTPRPHFSEFTESDLRKNSFRDVSGIYIKPMSAVCKCYCLFCVETFQRHIFVHAGWCKHVSKVRILSTISCGYLQMICTILFCNSVSVDATVPSFIARVYQYIGEAQWVAIIQQEAAQSNRWICCICFVWVCCTKRTRQDSYDHPGAKSLVLMGV